MNNPSKQLFYSYPPFKNNRIKIIVLTPFRRILIEEWMLKPASFVLHLAIVFAAIELYLQHFGKGTLRFYFPHLTLPMALSYIGVFFTLLFSERKSRYFLTRMLFGLTIKVVFKKDKITVIKGLSRKPYDRNLDISFSSTPIKARVLPAYMNAGLNFNLVIGNHRAIKITEAWDIKLVSRLVNNCNAALRMGFEQTLDIDPRELALRT